jgi:hypothetical protein
LFQYPSGFIFLGEARFLPISSAEARISKLPSIGISDVDTGFSPFSYTIPSNNKTFAVSVAYHYLFQQATEHGWVLSHGMYSDMIKKKLNSFINQFLYLFDYRLTALATLDVRISNFSARRKPVFRRKSYRRWRWWLPIRHKFYPSQAFTYSVRDERWAKKYGFLTDLPIDLSVSVYLIDSLRVLARIKLIEDRLFKDNNRKYLRYLNRRSRPRNKGRFNPWLYIIIIILK